MLFTLRSALRSLKGAPFVNLVVVACVGLGVGATTTVFAWGDHLVRRPLPAVDAMDRVVSVVSRTRGREDGVSYPDYRHWREQGTTLEGLAAFGLRQFGVRAADADPLARQSVWGVLVTDNYFDVLRVRPGAGRFFAAQDTGAVGESAVAVVSERLARRLGGIEESLGTRIRINETVFTVIGVTPANFVGTYAGLAFDLWVPITMQEAIGGDVALLESRAIRWMQAFGRLRHGISLAEARAELQSISRHVAASHPENRDLEAFVTPLDTGAAQRLERLFSVLMGLTGVVSLIVCTNVANLLMLRGAARASEFGIRLSLGASRRQLLAQLLVESVILAWCGAAAGMLAARSAQDILPALMPASPLPFALGGRWNPSILAFALAVASAMVLVFGIAPAVHALRRSTLPHASRGSVGSTRREARLRGVLVVAQLALSMAALACAGSFLRVNGTLAAIDRGIDRPEDILLVSTELDQAGYHAAADRVAIAERLAGRLRAIPGVKSAALATFVPLGFIGYSSLTIAVPGYVAQPEEDLSVLANRVSSAYFETLGIALEDGRALDDRDTPASPLVTVVNEAFAKRFLRDRAVGRQIELGGQRVTVVGVVADGKYRFDALDKPAPPFLYVPFAQQPRGSITMHLRAAVDPDAVVQQVRRAVGEVNPSLPLTAVTTMEEYTSLPLFPVRLATTVVGGLGTVALLLAVTGLYGVLSYRLSQRRKELAVRLALGAAPARLLRLVLRDGLSHAAVGVSIGAALALAITHLIAARLPRVRATDPTVLAAAASVLLVVAVVATLPPALRAFRIDPTAVLKTE